jgi:hypothetical protein
VSHFFENTIREAKAKSQRKEIHLLDSEKEEHTIIFYRGKMIDIICPKQNTEDQQKDESN